MSKNDFEEFQKQLQKMFGNVKAGGPFGFQPQAEPESSSEEVEEEPEEDIFEKIRTFNLKPKEIRDELDKFVIKQDEAKKVLSVAVCDHYNHVRRTIDGTDVLGDDYAKQNILVLGPTGVGKTYLLKCIAKIIGVPFVKADATKFSETGYVGRDVEDMVRDLVKTADGNVDLAEFGIVYIDEIDKLSNSGGSGGGKDVNGRGVQINLLKLMEEAEVSLKSQMDMMGQMEFLMDMNKSSKKKKQTINTRHILFIVSGAFSNLSELIQRRVSGSKIGFMADNSSSEDDYEYLRLVETPDLVNYGFEPEFIGRLPVRVACESLKSEDLKQILINSEGSILKQYVEDFSGYGIKFDIDESAMDRISQKAHSEQTGARGLMTVLERTFRSFKFELPSTQIDKFMVNAGTVDNPQECLAELLDANLDLQKETLKAEVDKFVERFSEEYGFTLKFNSNAIKALVAISIEKDKTIRAICEDKFKDFPYGLKLISENTNCRTFTVNKAVIDDPDKELSKWVVERFQKEDGSSNASKDSK
ncbi:MAG: AAA family ATPase [Lentisphaeraceae bacterium]|nr:AAA family ATPase [Lentisphaeraceae bacterium]